MRDYSEREHYEPKAPVRAINFNVTGHLFMTVSDIAKIFITKYASLRKFKYKNPSQLLQDIAKNIINKEDLNTINVSTFLVQCKNKSILSKLLNDDNDNDDDDDDDENMTDDINDSKKKKMKRMIMIMIMHQFGKSINTKWIRINCSQWH